MRSVVRRKDVDLLSVCLCATCFRGMKAERLIRLDVLRWSQVQQIDAEKPRGSHL